MRHGLALIPLLASLAASAQAPAEAPPESRTLPVREVTVFKDGHAFVLHNGATPTDADGNVVLDHLPAPVLGTFWAYSDEPKAELTGVRSGRSRVTRRRTALDVSELLLANPGKRLEICEHGESPYEATLIGIPTRSAEELERLGKPYEDDKLAQHGAIAMLRTAKGVKPLAIDKIARLTFLDEPGTTVPFEEHRERLTLRLDWKGNKAKQATVGMTYLQKGIRWIPQYRIDTDGEGKARVTLQATLINELVDLTNVTAHLVVGVPSFAFKDKVDPISLQKAVAQLSQHFQTDSQTAYAFSNAIMSQAVWQPNHHASQPQPANGGGMDLGPTIEAGGRSEDLYVFRVENLTLRKGERLTLPLADMTMDYDDVYILDVSFRPPQEIMRNFNSRQQSQLAKAFHAPKVEHRIRLHNRGGAPITTAPALLLRNGRVLAQSMTTYTAPGNACDLTLTQAVNISVARHDRELERIPEATRWRGIDFMRVDLEGTLTLHNFGDKTVTVEIQRRVLGTADNAGADGKIEALHGLDTELADSGSYPYWWRWYSWPWWWSHFNPISQIAWKQEIEPGGRAELTYTWHYFWH